MIELFSKGPDFLPDAEGLETAPLHIDDEVSSLSAILLDDDYYDLLLKGIRTISGVSVLDVTAIIPFKVKAYLELSDRRNRLGDVDSRKVKKHKNDVFRLAQLLTGRENIVLPDEIAQDMRLFLSDCSGSSLNLKQIGIVGPSMATLLETIAGAYSLAIDAAGL